MGVMRFLVHPGDIFDRWPEAYRAYISGFDGRVCPTRIEIDGPILTCRRQTAESGRLHVAWPVAGFGRPMVSTSCLREQDKPYLLSVELARGKICQLRNQVAAWQSEGLALPPGFETSFQHVHRLFARAVLLQHDAAEAGQVAERALHACFGAAEQLMQAYVEQRLAIRRQRFAQLPALMGCNLGRVAPEGAAAREFCRAFNAAAVPVEWKWIEPEEGEYHWDLYDRQVEWCLANRLLMRGGPLLDLSPGGLPQWLWQWAHDLLNLQSFVCDFVETAISRYMGRVRIWEVSAHGNTGGALTLTEENRLTLVARTLEVARQVDPESQFVIGVDQPWGGYQARGQHRLSPIQFVDALHRCGVGLTGVNLQISIGYRPRGTASRDRLEFSRLLDLWSGLGLPLHVTLSLPSSGSADAKSNPDLEVDHPSWRAPWSEAAQAEWINEYVPLIMAKQSVVGIYWGNFSDAEPHEFPHSGLLREDGAPKPALQEIIRHRQA